MHYELRKKLWRSFFQRLLLTAPQTVPLNSTQKRDTIGEECGQIASGFSDKGQMIWGLRRSAHLFQVIHLTSLLLTS